MCCDPTQCPAACVHPTSIPHILHSDMKPVLTAQPADPRDPSVPPPLQWDTSGRGSDMVTEGKGRPR